MPDDLSKIKNIVILMMENRSFDHMLGYLSLAPFNRTDVEGQSLDPAWLQRFTNYDGGQAYQPFHSTDPHMMPDDFDPPHGRSNIADHIHGVIRDRGCSARADVYGVSIRHRADTAQRDVVHLPVAGRGGDAHQDIAQNHGAP